jgi:hypothetical protein
VLYRKTPCHETVKQNNYEGVLAGQFDRALEESENGRNKSVCSSEEWKEHYHASPEGSAVVKTEWTKLCDITN